MHFTNGRDHFLYSIYDIISIVYIQIHVWTHFFLLHQVVIAYVAIILYENRLTNQLCYLDLKFNKYINYPEHYGYMMNSSRPL